MSLNTQLSNASANAEANALAALLNSGLIRIYSGTQPATADTAITSQTLLATLTFNATAFPTAVNGVVTANAIAQDPSAAASGTASWFRCLKSDATTVVMDGSIGTASANLVLNSVAISSGAAVQCSSFVYTVQKATAGL